MASRSNKTVRYAQPAMVSSAPKTPPRSGIMNSMRSAVSSRKPVSTSGSLARGIAQQVVTDRNGNRQGARPTVGQADPATRRRALDAALKPGPAVKPAPMAPMPAAPVYEGGGMGNKKRRKVIDDTVDRMSR